MGSPHLDADWLRQKYLTEGLSTYDIAKIVGRDPKSIYRKLVDFGIPTRPRGQNLKGEDNSWAQDGYVPHWLGRKHTAESRAKIAESASRPRPWLRGEANGMHGMTGSLNPRYVDGSSPERQRAYASAEWKAMMRAVYARDGYACVNCGAAKTKPKSLHAHHIYPWAGYPALRFEMTNLVTLCRDCHQWVHSRGNVDRKWLPHEMPSRSISDSTKDSSSGVKSSRRTSPSGK